MSASRMPTFSPSSRSASARLTAVVDLPTPPLPEAMAMMAATPGIPAGDGAAGPGGAAGRAPDALRCERHHDRLNTRQSSNSFLCALTNGFPRFNGAGINRDREEHFTVGDN